MNAVLPANTSTLWFITGWTMIHFLWLGATVAAVALGARMLLRRVSANSRYAVALASLVLLAALPPSIAAWLVSHYSPIALVTTAKTSVVDLTASVPAAPPSLAAPTLPSTVPLAASARRSAVASSAASSPMVASQPVEVDAIPTKFSDGLNAVIPYLPWLWLIGTPLTFVLLISGVVGTRRLSRASHIVSDDPIVDLLAHLATSLRISRRVAIAVCDRVASPVLIGIVRPMILLPPAALTGWSPDEIEMVLLHELAHVRRWDNLVNLLQRCLESLLFFHPAVWLISAWVRSEREACCDATVVSRTNRPHAYAELLVALAAQLPRSVLFHPAASSAMSAGPLRSRIRQILKMEDDPMLISGKSLAIVLAAAFTATVALVLYMPTTSHAEPSTANDAAEAGSKQDKDDSVAKSKVENDHDPESVQITLEVNREGRTTIRLSGKEVTEVRLNEAIELAAKNSDEAIISVKAEKGVPYGEVMAIVNQLEAKGIKKLSLDTRESSNSASRFSYGYPFEFHYVVPFEKGASKFLDGDEITITEIRGTAKEFEPGNYYHIKGKYKLHSHAAAQLNAYTTAKEAKDGISSGPDQKAQSQKVNQGEGDFTLVLPMTVRGWPHVSFYPADGGEDFGGVYFGTGDTVLKEWWGEKSDDKVEPTKLPSKSEFKYEVKFENGVSKFLDGDDITIDEIRSNVKTIEPGNNYWVHGKYKLHSHPTAQLSAFTTAKEAKDGTGPIQSIQTQKISHGDAEFTIILPMTVRGWPHLSFYNTATGEGFGGIYFGNGDSVLKESWAFGKLIEDEKEVEQTRFKHFETSLKTIELVIAVFNDKAGYSHQLKPVFDKLSKEHHSLNLWGSNIDPNSPEAARYHLTGEPTCIVFHDGKETSRLAPIKDADQLIQFVERAADNPKTSDSIAEAGDDGEHVGEVLVTLPNEWQSDAGLTSSVLSKLRDSAKKNLCVDLVQKDGKSLLVVVHRPTEKDWPAILGEPPRKDRVIAEKAWLRLGIKLIPLNAAEINYQQMERGAGGVKIIGGNVPKGLPVPSVLTTVAGVRLESMDTLLQWLDGGDGQADTPVRCFAIADDNEYMFDAQPPTTPAQDGSGSTSDIKSTLPTPSIASPYASASSKLPWDSAKLIEEALQRKSEWIDRRLAAKTDKEIEVSKREVEAANKHLEEVKRQIEEAKRQIEIQDQQWEKQNSEKSYKNVEGLQAQPRSASSPPAAAWPRADQSWAKATSPQSKPSSLASAEEIEVLRDRVTTIEDQLTFTTERLKAGRGATELDVKRAASDLAVAQSELALAQGNHAEAISKLEDAQKEAEVALTIQSESARAGVDSPDLDAVLKAKRNLSDIKLKLIRLQHEALYPASNDAAGESPVPLHPRSEQPTNSESDDKTSSYSARPVTPVPDVTHPDGTVTHATITQHTSADGQPVYDTITVAGPLTVTVPAAKDDSPAQAATQNPDLRFDGKTFDEWRKVWKNELSTEKRIEAVRALGAFGRAGYGKQAAETILDVASQYNFLYLEGNETREGRLQSAVFEELTPEYRDHTLAKYWLPDLVDRLKKDPQKWKDLAAMLMYRLRTDDPVLIATLQSLAESGPGEVRGDALGTLVALSRERTPGPQLDDKTQTLVDSALRSQDSELVRSALGQLPYYKDSNRGGGRFGSSTLPQLLYRPAMVSALFDPNEDVRRYARSLLQYIDQKDAPDLINQLVAVLADDSRAHDHIEAVRAVAAIGGRAPDAIKAAKVPRLLMGLCQNSKDKELILASLVALEDTCGPNDIRHGTHDMPELKRALPELNESQINAVLNKIDYNSEGFTKRYEQASDQVLPAKPAAPSVAGSSN